MHWTKSAQACFWKPVNSSITVQLAEYLGELNGFVGPEELISVNLWRRLHELARQFRESVYQQRSSTSTLTTRTSICFTSNLL